MPAVQKPLGFVALATWFTLVSSLIGQQHAPSSPLCENGNVVSSSFVMVGDKKVNVMTIACAADVGSPPSKRTSIQTAWGQCGGVGWTGPTVCAAGSTCTTFNSFYSQCIPVTPTPPPATSSVHASSTSSAPLTTPTISTNVCNEVCTDTCGKIGDLPPISEDCDTIIDSITILNGSISPTFDVAPNSIEQLTFGTCRFWFQNNSPETLTFCWTSLAQTASVAEAACFPPVQPVQSVGLCTPSDGLWQVGVGHS